MVNFEELMELTNVSESFFYKDFNYIDGAIYRIFNYRLAGWEEFQTLEGAKESRGIMYRQNDNMDWELVAMPMEKFFNAHEGAVKHNWENPMSIMVKEDGSLISSYIDVNGNLGLKTKGALSSVQAHESMEWLRGYPEYYEDIRQVTSNGFTINFEWVSPTNRIVLSYGQPELIILNFRNRENGSYSTINYIKEEVLGRSSVLEEFMVESIVPETDTVEEFVNSIQNMTEIEGFVIQKECGEYVKVKTEEYLVLHKTKDSVSNPKALFEVVIEDASDDLRTIFADDENVLQLINKMEKVVIPMYNRMVNRVEAFFSVNRNLDRKEFAILGQKELEKYEFGLAMSMFVGKNVDYKKTMKKRWQSLSNSITNEIYGINYKYGG